MEERLCRSLQFAIPSEVPLVLVILHSLILSSMEAFVKSFPIIFLMFNPLDQLLGGNTITVDDLLLVPYFNGSLFHTSIETENDLKIHFRLVYIRTSST